MTADNNKEYCDGGCGEKGVHEVVYCIKCNERLDPCDESPNPIEFGDTAWICEVCYEKMELIFVNAITPLDKRWNSE